VVGRAHLSIGEVLSLLQDEFPEVTISKIRFLESQGLVDPERTPSGYRKFYEPDIERLRWVLRQQRDAFLPLKVIKGRLQDDPEGDSDGSEGAPGTEQVVIEEGYLRVELTTEPLSGNGDATEPVPGGAAPSVKAPTQPRGGSGAPAPGAAQLFDAGPPYSSYSRLSGEPEAGGPTRAARAAKTNQADSAASAARSSSPSRAPSVPADDVAAPVGKAETPKSSRQARSRDQARDQARDQSVRPVRGPHDDELALADLVDEAGVDVETVRDLEQYGLITSRVIGGAPYYTREAAVIARLAWSFARHGVEARHLRAYKGAAEREAGLVQQVIMPLLRQRNPQAREAAAQAVDELSELGGELRAALLRAALADLR
jgi:DNA-binding transcriptional MerR regulator